MTELVGGFLKQLIDYSVLLLELSWKLRRLACKGLGFCPGLTDSGKKDHSTVFEFVKR